MALLNNCLDSVAVRACSHICLRMRKCGCPSIHTRKQIGLDSMLPTELSVSGKAHLKITHSFLAGDQGTQLLILSLTYFTVSTKRGFTSFIESIAKTLGAIQIAYTPLTVTCRLLYFLLIFFPQWQKWVK